MNKVLIAIAALFAGSGCSQSADDSCKRIARLVASESPVYSAEEQREFQVSNPTIHEREMARDILYRFGNGDYTHAYKTCRENEGRYSPKRGD